MNDDQDRFNEQIGANLFVTGIDLTGELLEHVSAAWERIRPEFVSTLRKLPNVGTEDVINAFLALAITEGSQTFYAKSGKRHPRIRLAVPDEFTETIGAWRRRRPTREPARSEAEYTEILRDWAGWWEGNWTQEEFAHAKGWKSRTPLTDALRWFKDTHGVDFIKGNNRKQKHK